MKTHAYISKTIAIIAISLISFNGIGQTTYISDNFTDGDMAGWTTGNDGVSDGTMQASSNYMSSGTVGNSGTLYAYQTMTGLDVTADVTTWTFSITDLVNPSTGNNWGVWLMANETNLQLINGASESNTIDGYLIGCNATGSNDSIYMYRVTNGAYAQLGYSLGFSGASTSETFSFEITRSAAAAWDVNVNGGGSELTVTDTTYKYANPIFGLTHEHTAAGDNQVRMDDVSVVNDVTQPCPTFDGPKFVWINEIHYMDDGYNTQGFEIIAPSFTDLSCYSVQYYSEPGTVQAVQALSGTSTVVENSIGATWFNATTDYDSDDDHDGALALQWNGTCGGSAHVVDFLSWGGAITATTGIAVGVTSVDIGITESAGSATLQRSGTGNFASDMNTWSEAAQTTGTKTTGQELKHSIFINEFHYTDAGTPDTGEGIEISAPAGTDLSCYSVYEYRGSGATNSLRGTHALTGTVDDECNGLGTKWIDITWTSTSQSDPAQFALVYNGDNCTCQGGSSLPFALSTNGSAVYGDDFPFMTDGTSIVTTRTLDVQGNGEAELEATQIGNAVQMVGNNVTHYEDLDFWSDGPASNDSIGVFLDLGGCKADGRSGDGADGSSCIDITQTFNNGCTGNETESEFIVMRTGYSYGVNMNDLFISTSEGTVFDINGFTNVPAVITQINDSIAAGGGAPGFIQGVPADGYIPAGSRLIVVNGPAFDPSGHDNWEDIVGASTYMAFATTDQTGAHMLNSGTGNYTLTVGVAGPNGCLEQVTHRVDDLGGATDGDRFNYASDGTATADVTSGCRLLPIRLINFEAQNSSNGIDIFWSTATETNNHYFTIEKSLDGINFYPILKESGAGTSKTTLHYYVKDNEPHNGLNYYRLKQTDYDGKYSYSKVVAVNYIKNEFSYSSITTNYGKINCKINTPNNSNQIHARILNSTGFIVYSNNIKTTSPTTSIEIITANFANGTYFLQVFNKTDFINTRIQINN